MNRYALLLLIPSLAQAAPEFRGVNSLEFRLEPGSERASLWNRLWFDIFGPHYRVGGRFDIDESIREDPLLGERIAQRYIEYKDRRVELRLGNFYKIFSQGMVLYAVEDEALKMDHDIDGGELKFDLSEARLNLLAGRPRKEESLERKDLIYGAELSLNPSGFIELGGSYLRFDAANLPEDPSFGLPVEERAGLDLQALLNPLLLRFGYARRFTWGRRDPTRGWVGTKNVNGRGLVLGCDLTWPGFGLMFDYRRYYRLNGIYQAPPAIGYTGRSVNQGYDEEGFQIQGVLTPGTRLSTLLNYSQGWHPERTQSLKEGRVEFRYELNRGGYLVPWFEARQERSIESAYLIKEEVIPGLELEFPIPLLTPRIEIQYKLTEDSLIAGIQRRYRDWLINTSLSVARFTLTGSFEKTTKPPDELEPERYWLRAGISVDLSGHFLELSYGRSRAKLECSQGYCRYEPAFYGLILRLTSRF